MEVVAQINARIASIMKCCSIARTLHACPWNQPTEISLLVKGPLVYTAVDILSDEGCNDHLSSNCFTCSASTRDAVSPGLSIPYRQTRPRIPWCAGPWTIKSAAGWPGAETFGRMPASSNAAEIDKSALSNDIENVPQEIYDKGVSKQRTGA
eukprot:1136697-Pelagomonas_calceolata.AAC.13